MLRFPNRPTTTTLELQRDVIDLVQRLGPAASAIVIQDVTVGTVETPVAHGLGETPVAVLAMPHSDARVWRSSPSDTERVFLTASASAVCDLLVLS